MVVLRLRFSDGEIDLHPGELVIGRAATCSLRINDSTVSRRHARIVVTAEGATIEDLESRNGVTVNGMSLRAPTRLVAGDHLRIGDTELSVVNATRALAPTHDALRAVRVSVLPGAGPSLTDEVFQPTAPSAFLLGLAEKALALGRLEEAEWIVKKFAEEIDARLGAGQSVTPETLAQTARVAIELATATGGAAWIDWVFDLHRALGRLIDAETIAALHTLVRRLRYPATASLRAYHGSMMEGEATMTPAERFLVSRLEGLLDVARLH